jgi:hypothetical protein
MFEMCLPQPERWVGTTPDFVDDKYSPLWGPNEMHEIYKDAEEAARDELDDALKNLVEIGDPLGMTGARIKVWDGIGAKGRPVCVIEATADQLAEGRLRLANWHIQKALGDVELARKEVRVQVVKAATESRMSRNSIARVVSGSLARRLVLQLLAGHDLVEAIRDSLPTWQSRYRRWYPPDFDTATKAESRYLGPFRYGPVELSLASSGQVYLRLVDIDGPDERDFPIPTDNDDPDVREFYDAQEKRSHGYAREVLPLLTEAGFKVQMSGGTEALAGDLAQTLWGGPLLVTDS